MRRLIGIVALAVVAGCGSPSSGVFDGLITDVAGGRVTVSELGGGGSETFVDESDVGEPHLREHQREDWPVRVFWETRDGDKIAVEIEDLEE